MKRPLFTLAVCLLIAAGLNACAARGSRAQEALQRVKARSSGTHGLSMERAVQQFIRDVRATSRSPVVEGKWYSNHAIEYDKADVYKVGYQFSKDGRTTRLSWLYYIDEDRLVPLSEAARQFHP